MNVRVLATTVVRQPRKAWPDQKEWGGVEKSPHQTGSVPVMCSYLARRTFPRSYTGGGAAGLRTPHTSNPLFTSSHDFPPFIYVSLQPQSRSLRTHIRRENLAFISHVLGKRSELSKCSNRKRYRLKNWSTFFSLTKRGFPFYL